MIKQFNRFLLRVLNTAFPECNLKNKLRCLVHDIVGFFPINLLMKTGDYVVLVGFHSKSMLSRISRIVGESGKVIVIEPEDDNVKGLLDCIKTNSLRNVTLIKKAAWNKEGHHKLLIAKKLGDHKLEQDNIIHDNDFKGHISTKMVEVDTMDNILSKLRINSVDYSEITVNGAELKVLEGMKNTIGNVKRLFVKGHARVKETGKPINQLLVSFLDKHGFKTYITKGSESVAEEWGMRDGDVYAWKL